MVSPLQWLRARAAKMKQRTADGPDSPKKTPRAAVVIVSLAVVAIFALSLWYFVQPQPLLVQGEADATRIDISARVDGRVARRPVDRGQNVTAGQILVTIDNPELLTKLKEPQAAQAVALADFKRIEVGTRAQVYHTSAEVGEFVSPGVPLLSLIDLSDVWLRFDLREDLVRGLKIGDRFEVRVPALGDRLITVAIRKIATRGEYAGWRATRATGDFDLRTFNVRAYPVDPVPELRPGMSAYANWKSRP